MSQVQIQEKIARKILIAGVIAGALYGQSVEAGQYTLSWDASQGATAYVLYQSSDNAVTWTKVYEGPLTTFTVDIQGTAVFLFNVAAVRDGVQNTRRDVGAWAIPSLAPYNGEITIR